MSCAPVVLLVFNRADMARRVVEGIRHARPPQLFVGADGPRDGNPDDVEAVGSRERLSRRRSTGPATFGPSTATRTSAARPTSS